MDTFDFWYAVNNTEVIRSPIARLETFGTTKLRFHLVSELMDDVDKVRVREGSIEAARPQILTPQDMMGGHLEGFGSEEANRYLDYLREHQQSLRILQYGFKISKNDTNDYILSDSLVQVLENVVKEVDARNHPMSAVLLGVEDPWEVSLLKLLVEVVEHSTPGNIAELKSHNLLPLSAKDIAERMEREFLEASRNPDLIQRLFEFLKRHGLFDQNQDRFFALVRASQAGR